MQPSAISYFNHLKVDSTLGSTLSPGVYGWTFEYDTPHASPVTFRFDNDHYRIYSGAGFGEIARFTDTGRVGIGTTSPSSKLEVDGGDIEVDDSASGLILRSPDGTRYRVTVANGGTLSVSAV